MREIRQSGSEGGEVMSLLDPYAQMYPFPVRCDPIRGRNAGLGYVPVVCDHRLPYAIPVGLTAYI